MSFRGAGISIFESIGDVSGVKSESSDSDDISITSTRGDFEGVTCTSDVDVVFSFLSIGLGRGRGVDEGISNNLENFFG